MAKTAVRPKIIVQAAYTGGADMRELFISLLVNEVRRGNSSPRTLRYSNFRNTMRQYRYKGGELNGNVKGGSVLPLIKGRWHG